MKVCKRCGEEKQESDFFIYKETGKLRPNCKRCVAEMVRENRHANPERAKETNLRNAKKDYRRRKDAVNRYKKDWYESNRKDVCLRVSRNFHAARVPGGNIDTELTDLVFDEAYDLARMREKVLGGRWTLDHIAPVQSPLVCGLHVWSNMQVIRDSENGRKSNLIWPDMP